MIASIRKWVSKAVSGENATNKKTGATIRNQDAELAQLRKSLSLPGRDDFESELAALHDDSRRRIEQACKEATELKEETTGQKSARKHVLQGRRVCGKDLLLLEEKKEIEVFVSSTFTDTEFERTALLAFLQPKLRKLCREVGFEFSFREMRWGVTSYATDENQTFALCINELERCVKESAALSFIGILGEKYGYRPVPCTIPEEDFDRVYTDAHSAKAFYQLDENCVPPQMVLKPRTDPEWKKEKGPQDKEEYLRQLLRRNVDWRSITEKEMEFGFSSKDCILVSRTFLVGKEKPVNKAFFDESNDSTIMIERLRKQLSEHLDSDSIINESLPWLGGIDPIKHSEHGAYLRRLILALNEKILRSIERAAIARHLRPKNSAIIEELLQHEHLASVKLQDFYGRQEIIDTVLNEINSGQNILLYGLSGTGKTSLLAKIRSQLPSQTRTALRFLGLTAMSKSSSQILSSLCQQISECYGFKIGNDLDTLCSEEIAAYLKEEIFPLATQEAPLVILLDGLDQLARFNEDSCLAWMPSTKQYPYVTVLASIVATTSEDCHVPTFTCVQCPKLQAKEAQEVLSAWLKRDQRALQPQQFSELVHVLERSSHKTLLFLRVLYKESRHWKSSELSSTIEAIQKISTIDDALKLLFDRLEKELGVQLVRWCIGLITASQDGLSVNELSDLASLDDEVLVSVLQWWVPPTAHVPHLILARLVRWLGDFLVGGHWYHRTLESIARKYFVKQDHYVAINAYFSGQLSKSPIDHTTKDKIKWRLSANRHVAPQPWYFGLSPNHRKASELCAATLELCRRDAQYYLNDALELVMSVDFVVGMIASGLKQDLDHALKILQGNSLNDGALDTLVCLQSTLSLCEGPILEQPQEFPSQWLVRTTLPKNPYAQRLFDQALDACFLEPVTSHGFAKAESSTLARFNQHAEDVTSMCVSPDSSLIASLCEKSILLWRASDSRVHHVLSHAESEKGHLCFSPSGQYLAASGSRELMVWCVESGDAISRTVFDDLLQASFFDEDRLVCVQTNSICLLEISVGPAVQTETGQSSIVKACIFGNGQIAVVTEDGLALIYQISPEEISLVGQINTLMDEEIVTIAASESYFAVADESGRLGIWSTSSHHMICFDLMETLETKSREELETRICVTSLAFSKNDDMLVAGREDGDLSIFSYFQENFDECRNRTIQVAPGETDCDLVSFLTPDRVVVGIGSSINVISLEESNASSPPMEKIATSFSFTKSGSHVVLGCKDCVQLLETSSARVINKLPLPGDVMQAEVCPRAARETALLLVEATPFPTLYAWEIGQPLRVLWRGVECFAATFSGTQVVAVKSSRQGLSLVYLDAAQTDRVPRWQVPIQAKDAFGVACHPTRNLCAIMASSDDNERLLVHDLVQGREVVAMDVPEDSGEAMWTSDGTLLVVFNIDGYPLRVYCTETWQNQAISVQHYDVAGLNQVVVGERLLARVPPSQVGISLEVEAAEWAYNSQRTYMGIIHGGNPDEGKRGAFDLFKIRK